MRVKCYFGHVLRVPGRPLSDFTGAGTVFTSRTGAGMPNWLLTFPSARSPDWQVVNNPLKVRRGARMAVYVQVGQHSGQAGFFYPNFRGMYTFIDASKSVSALQSLNFTTMAICYSHCVC